MSLRSTNELQRLCRTCMCQKSVSKTVLWQSIYAEQTVAFHQTMYIADLLAVAIPQLNIHASDELPKEICAQCLAKLESVYEFQQMCLKTERQLRGVLELASDDVSDTKSMQINAAPATPSEDPLSVKDDTTFKVEKALDTESCKVQLNTDTTALEVEHLEFSVKVESSKMPQVEEQNEIDLKTVENTVEAVDMSEGTLELVKKHNKCARNTYACEICTMQLKTLKTLKKHNRRRHATTVCAAEQLKVEHNKSHVCEFCNKAFQQSSTLKDHLRTHTGEQPFLCSECGKAFNSSSNMRQHLLRHSGEKRYECPECPKKFPCLSDLASHKAVHKKFKPHICDTCGAAFGKPYQLKKHKMYHTNDKPYKCEYCEMRFVCVDHMRRHLRTHTGEKPYKCKYCERAFAQSNDLIKHLRSHLGENVYKCELCPQAFRLATEMRAHFAVHKNDDSATRERNLQALLEEDERLRLKLPSSGRKPVTKL